MCSAVAAFAVDDEQVAGVAFEEDFEVGGAGVAAGDGGEDAALGGEHGQAAALFGEQGGGGFGGDVVGDQPRYGWHGDARRRRHGGGLGVGDGFVACSLP